MNARKWIAPGMFAVGFPPPFAGRVPFGLFWLLIWPTSVSTVVAQVEYVDPNIGSIAHLLQPTRPTVSVPYGMVRMYPVRKDGTDDQIQYFPLTIISHRLGELFSVVPWRKPPEPQDWHRAVSYDQEKLTPYYYSGQLEDSGIQIEFTPTARAGTFRFTFPAGKPTLLISTRHEGELRPGSTNTFTGVERFNNMSAFVYGEFSVPVALSTTNEGGKAHMVVIGEARNRPEPPPLNPSEGQLERKGGEGDGATNGAAAASGSEISATEPQRQKQMREPKDNAPVEKGSFLLRIFRKRHPRPDGGEALLGSSSTRALTNTPPGAEGFSNLVARSGRRTTGNVVELRYGISWISIEQAEKNLRQEIPEWGFDATEAQALSCWNHALSQIEVEGGTPAQRHLFFSAFYRCCERMINITEAGQYYSGFDRKVHADARPFYTDNGLWDTYRALEPLQTLLNPEMQADKLQSYVRMYQQSGWMPGFAVLWGNYACRTGNHVAAWMADAWFKGVRGFDLKTGFEGLRKNALEGTLLPWRVGPKCALDDFHNTHGYFPALKPGERETEPQVSPFERRQAITVTLEQSYDDWCTAQIARVLNREEDFQLFLKRAQNYKNLYRQEKGFMWPKDAAGEWIEPFDPQFSGGQGGRDYTTESNVYIYNWDVQHDYAGLAALMGGNQAAEAKLDQLFRADLGRSKYEFLAAFPDSTGLIGQFTVGNQPGMVIPYLYNHFGAPWKTQKRIRQVLDCWFADSPLGFPGDEDGGAMSAFVVFSMMGIYPVVPGLPVYELGSPVFDKVALRLQSGKLLRIICKHNSPVNKYIQSVVINGRQQDRVWFRHDDVLKGMTIELEMGDTPNKALGAQEKNFPPSSLDLNPITLQ
jgi:predicted alpha-1,2-mannosidase